MRITTCLAALALISCDQPELRECAEEQEVFVYADNDLDGFGAEPIGYFCEVGEGQSLNALDCDDTRPEVFPDADEMCDDIDNNCDGRVDESALLRAWFEDMDGDGFGDPATERLSCLDLGKKGYVLDSNDCDDTDDTSFPGGVEVCDNGVDEDCSGQADDIVETCDDGLDNDCDGLLDCDDDECLGSVSCQLPCADEVLPQLLNVVATGSTVGQGDTVDAPCGVAGAEDYVFQYVVPQDGTYVIDTNGSTFDTILHVYLGCAVGNELACNDDGGDGLQSQVTINAQQDDPLIIVVDGYNTASGTFTLNVNVL